jgi:hypothetical protein
VFVGTTFPRSRSRLSPYSNFEITRTIQPTMMGVFNRMRSLLVIFNTIIMTSLPPLPPLHHLLDHHSSHYSSLLESHGFDECSNWLIPGTVMQGQHPTHSRPAGITNTHNSSTSTSTSSNRIYSIVHFAGCRTFVCLQAESPPHNNDDVNDYSRSRTLLLGGFQDWKNNPTTLKSYKADVVSAVNECTTDAGVPTSAPTFIHFGIRDFDIVDSLEGLSLLIDLLGRRVRAGETLYIHCWGGKGRAGLVSACLLGELYGFHTLDAEEALKRVEVYANLRNSRMGGKIHSPETDEQKNQVRAFYDLRR